MSLLSNAVYRFSFLAFGLLLVCFDAVAQNLPATQVWLLKIENGIPVIPILISASDRYNNQPMFSPDDGEIYFTAEQEDGQTDIARYQINNGQLDLVSNTPDSEYSPTPIPGENAVSVIRVEAPDQIQRLWSISLADGDSELLMPKVEPVGYHSWIGRNSVAVFILGESFSLHTALIGDQPSTFIFDNIGRTIRWRPETGEILFVSKNTQPWTIAAINAESGDLSKIMPLFPAVEDFEIDASGHYWMGYGSKLYRSDVANEHWELTADLQSFGIDNISRLASSPDGNSIAIVAGR